MDIRVATPADAAVMSELARRTFYETFAASNDAADMALYLAGAYSIDIQTRELNDRDVTTLLVEDVGTAIAYAMLRTGHVPELLMARVETAARERGAKTMWLGVWERNDRARAFYAKCGFVDAGEHIFLFGTDPQTDRVMVMAL